MSILKVSDLTRSFGGLIAVRNVGFEVRQGEILAVIGPNGAGKTTLFNLISGYLKPDSGRITFDGADITGVMPHLVATRGLARTFQIVQIFSQMTVFEAVTAAALLHLQKKEALTLAEEVLAQVGLSSKQDTSPADLSLQDRKMLELAKCIAIKPKLILLDEVIAGLTLGEAETPLAIIRDLRNSGMTIVMVEHVMPVIMKTADRIVVLNFGEQIAIGTPAEIVKNQSVRDAYFGEELDA